LAVAKSTRLASVEGIYDLPRPLKLPIRPEVATSCVSRIAYKGLRLATCQLPGISPSPDPPPMSVPNQERLPAGIRVLGWLPCNTPRRPYRSVKLPAHRTDRGEALFSGSKPPKKKGRGFRPPPFPSAPSRLAGSTGRTTAQNSYLLGSGPQSECATSTELRTSFRHRSMSRSLKASWFAPK
jgi:hypothetical protein